MSLHISRLAVSLTAEVPHEAMEQHSPASAIVVAEELAEKVIAYEQEHRLGYYAALDYYQQQGVLDNDLLDALQGLSWLASGLAREEVQTRLRPVFSSIRFSTVQSLAYGLPSVRPGQNNVLHKLIEHYTADKVKMSLIVTLVRKPEVSDANEAYAANLIDRWLRDRFSSFEINSLKVLD